MLRRLYRTSIGPEKETATLEKRKSSFRRAHRTGEHLYQVVTGAFWAYWESEVEVAFSRQRFSLLAQREMISWDLLPMNPPLEIPFGTDGTLESEREKDWDNSR